MTLDWAPHDRLPTTGRRRPHQGAIGLLATTVLLCSGCSDAPVENSLPNPIQATDTSGGTDLHQAIGFLRNLDQVDNEQVKQKIGYHLQQWLQKQPAAENVELTEILEPLATEFPDQLSQDFLAASERQITDQDIDALKEAIWFKRIAESVSRSSNLDPNIAKLVAATPDAPPTLAAAAKLFDWTMRNVQEDPSDTPNYLHAWQSVLYGHGTTEQKSRIFAILARQLGLPVVLLAADRNGDVTAWLPALFANHQVYLFDMNLGVPIPAPENRGIATLSQVVSTPEILNSLAMGSEPYRIDADDLNSIIALIDAPAVTLAGWAKTLENVLTGDDQISLTVDPTSYHALLKEIPEIQTFGIWTLPYRTHQFLAEVPPGSQVAAVLDRERNLSQPLVPARLLHFRGQFEPTLEEPGALSSYLELRVPEKRINQVRNQRLQENAPSDDPELEASRKQNQIQLANLEFLLRRTKANATYWLGIASFDRGQHRVAIDYLEKLLNVAPTSEWTIGAYYNLGRAYEALAMETQDEALLAKAVEQYLRVMSGPGSLPCRWRAAQLGAEVSQSTPSTEDFPDLPVLKSEDAPREPEDFPDLPVLESEDAPPITTENSESNAAASDKVEQDAAPTTTSDFEDAPAETVDTEPPAN